MPKAQGVADTELTPRKQAVLAAVVKAYIETGEPIGSKNLMSMLENAPSSATLRNEMNELCSLGFLDQPHTSAGRIPTSRGYRFYIDSVIKPYVLEDRVRELIDKKLGNSAAQSDSMPKIAGDMLASLTGFPAISLYLVGSGVSFKSLRLLPLGRKTAVMITITSDGRTQSRICRLPVEADEETISYFNKTANEKLRRIPLADFNRALLQTVTACSLDKAFALLPLYTELFEMAYSSGKSDVSIFGSDRLYGFCNENSVYKIVSLVNAGEPILSLLDRDNGKTEAVFGNETVYPELFGKVFITAPYFVNGSYCGRIGIIGTGRMPYEQIIPTIEYTAKKLGGCMTAAVKDMED